MAIMKAGWRTIRTSASTYELVPSHDVIEHKGKIICKCRPKLTTWFDGDGDLCWGITHNSFDEYLDEDQTEPYKGL